ncbi:hypothetical protein H4R35_005568 [Dimargaris xerosporica]|nr:hypothetical protein H4R35_005568 [Dimargaris xerosporica]
MLSHSLTIVTLFGLLWLSPVQPMAPYPKKRLQKLLPKPYSPLVQSNGILHNSRHHLPSDLKRILNDNDEFYPMDRASAEETDDINAPMGEDDTVVETGVVTRVDADAAIDKVNEEKFRLQNTLDNYTRFIKTTIKNLYRLGDGVYDAERYLGKNAISPQADWSGSKPIQLLLVYWNTIDKVVDFHIAQFMYDDIFYIDYKALCINGMYPALAMAVGTSIIDSSVSKTLATMEVAGINDKLKTFSMLRLDQLNTKVKAYQDDALARICTDRVTRYSVRIGKMESASLHEYNPKEAFSRQIRKQKQTRESSSLVTALVNAPRYRRLRNALQYYKLYVNNVLSDIQAIQGGSFDPRWYVFPIPPRPEVSKYSHEKDGFYLVYWDLELNEFKYKMATQDEITAYKDGNSVKLFDLMKSVCVIGRHYPANIPWEEFAKYMKAYFQWIEEKSPAGWKERLMRLRDAWKVQQVTNGTGNQWPFNY